jgi:hypothetical protein
MTSPETLHTKDVINELISLLITHMAYFGIRFDCYDFLIQVSLLDSFWTDWLYRCLVRFLGHKTSGTR